MIAFRTQFDKLVKAYMKNEVNPWSPCACFVGNLLNNHSYWADCRKPGYWGLVDDEKDNLFKEGVECILREGGNTYTVQEIILLEQTFMNAIGSYDPCHSSNVSEDILFNAFEKTLLHLREIHESKGEIIEDYTFTKRQLACQ